MTPLLDTLNGAEAYVAFPSQIPVAGSALNIEFPDPTERFPVNVPPVAFILPVVYTSDPSQYRNALALPTLNCPVFNQ
jgi:hypothetical protein